ncbi:hypothetical protein [Glycomyces niveus]|uniref:Uncharacterized protein n=1 Tax=Glycomyces niveus TaxID=2820287 RepID=A0ABS3U221_9ACTN|nr:hypothetical protein [Glycomyces sp. NEAU-S30]MBO3732785.1 hypothetical protein [Glycomyces sp. NEAU-S30]
MASRSVLSGVVVLAAALLLGLFGAIPLPLPWWIAGTVLLTAAGYLWAESTRADLDSRARQIRLHATVMCLVLVIAGVWIFNRVAAETPDRVYTYALNQQTEGKLYCFQPATYPGGNAGTEALCSDEVFGVVCWETGPEGGRWMRTPSGLWLPEALIRPSSTSSYPDMPKCDH